MDFNFALVIWWWQFGCSEGWVLETTIEIGLDVNAKSYIRMNFQEYACVSLLYVVI